MVAPFPGVLSLDYEGPFGDFVYAKTHPACGWALGVQPTQPMIEWRGALHLVEKTALSVELRATLGLLVPDELVPPERTGARRALGAASLVEVSRDLGSALVQHGVRVWTAGYHRHCESMRVAAAGGEGPAFCVDGPFFELALGDPPRGRPRSAPWRGTSQDSERVDRVLRALTGGVLGEPEVQLAHAIARSFPSLLADEAERRRKYGEVLAIRSDLDAEAGCYADFQYNSYEAEGWDCCRDEPPPETVAAARAMESLHGPAEIAIAPVGVFWRETLAPVTVRVPEGRTLDAWFGELPELAPPTPYGLHPSRELYVPPVTRYTARHRRT